MAKFYRGRALQTSAAAALLLLSYALLLSSALRHSATVDEQSHLLRGAAYLKEGATHFLLGHPLLASTLSALPLLTEAELALPTDSEAWAEGDWPVAGDQFLWQRSAAPQRLLFLGRLAVIWQTLALGALVCRWGRQLAGPAAGLAALALLLLDPNVLAHGRLITGDAPLALFVALALYGFWRFAAAGEMGRPGWPGLLLAGAGLGLAAATKFNAAVALPVLGVQALWLAWRGRRPRLLLALLPVVLLAWLVVAAVYRFELWRGFLPGGSFWADLIWQQRYVGAKHSVYFLGRVAGERQWLYFPAALLLKTPLPTLLLPALAFVVPRSRRAAGRPSRSLALFLLLPSLAFLLASMAVALNIGFRYLIPALPSLYLFVAARLLAARPGPVRRLLPALTGLLLLALAGRSVAVWPDYISFFNVLAGGNGWRLLADSNVDWGQDLPALARWQAEELPPGAPLYLSYFGTAHPSAYGVRAQALPTWPQAPEQAYPFTQPYDPRAPAPGYYAISVNNLHGLVLDEQRTLFHGFRERRPLARLGGSIFVYDVAATGPPADLALSGLLPATLSAPLRQMIPTNDLRLRWFDHQTSFIWPAAGGWMALPDDEPPPPELAAFWPATPQRHEAGQALYRLDEAPLPAWLQPAQPETDGPLRYRGMSAVRREEETLFFVTAWEVAERTNRPLKIFVHARDEHDDIVSQWDGMDILPSSWWPGDLFVQSHRLDLPAGAPVTHLFAGVYDGDTMERISALRLTSE